MPDTPPPDRRRKTIRYEIDNSPAEVFPIVRRRPSRALYWVTAGPYWDFVFGSSLGSAVGILVALGSVAAIPFVMNVSNRHPVVALLLLLLLPGLVASGLYNASVGDRRDDDEDDD